MDAKDTMVHIKVEPELQIDDIPDFHNDPFRGEQASVDIKSERPYESYTCSPSQHFEILSPAVLNKMETSNTMVHIKAEPELQIDDIHPEFYNDPLRGEQASFDIKSERPYQSYTGSPSEHFAKLSSAISCKMETSDQVVHIKVEPELQIDDIHPDFYNDPMKGEQSSFGIKSERPYESYTYEQSNSLQETMQDFNSSNPDSIKTDSFLETFPNSIKPETATTQMILPCSLCDDKFTDYKCLEDHWTTSHPTVEIYPCAECDRKFSGPIQLARHMKFHSGEKNFACTECERTFSQQISLKNHMRVHSGDKAFSCDQCDRSFFHKNSLDYHLRTHSGKKPFKCKLCPDRFGDLTHLKRHVRSHTGERPFTCQVCQRAFADNANLRRHSFIHTGERPFKCSVCTAGFNDRKTLKNHLKTHTGEKPYACTLCTSAFRDSGKLRRHMLIHTGDKPYACTICGRKYADKCEQKKHEAKCDGDQSQREIADNIVKIKEEK